MLLADLERNPGDILFGDDDGLIVGTVNEFARCIEAAKQIGQKEARMFARMVKDVRLFGMLNFEAHCAEIKDDKDSEREFLV